jgi:hypothetical protein
VKPHYCAQCRRADTSTRADVFVVGRFNTAPYRGYLCEDHLTMLCDEGLQVRHQQGLRVEDLEAAWTHAKRTAPLSPAGIAHMERCRHAYLDALFSSSLP